MKTPELLRLVSKNFGIVPKSLFLEMNNVDKIYLETILEKNQFHTRKMYDLSAAIGTPFAHNICSTELRVQMVKITKISCSFLVYCYFYTINSGKTNIWCVTSITQCLF